MLLYEWILLAIGTAGFGLGAYWDLKTTEFPDWLPYSIILAAISIRAAFSWFMGDWRILLSSIVVGCLFLGFGLLLSILKQWGDGDAWLLGSRGFLFPGYSGFQEKEIFIDFPVVTLFNFFLLSFFYLVAYSVALGLKHRKVLHKFKGEISKDCRSLLVLIVFFAAICFGAAFYLSLGVGIPLERMTNLLSLPFLFAFVLVFIRYGRFVEKNLFRKKIPVSKLKPGDVLANERWKGLTERQIRILRKKGGHVWIKEGVRFAPVFIINLYVTLFFGSLLWVFI
ncbi:MAG: hypothetical protein QXN71_01620 [Candidatus Aenigmatarchaeota archaeon]